jgi:hypothetical protein
VIASDRRDFGRIVADPAPGRPPRDPAEGIRRLVGRRLDLIGR